MKTSVHGSKTEGSVYSATLCIIAAVSIVLFSLTAFINVRYQAVCGQYESFYRGDQVYEID
ncbi:MAG: hypothetical protein IIT68_03140 [Treponema sp.]|nr:hypothetical protein [Treponema sp.]